MSGYINGFLTAFWSESVWLPPNTTWKDIEPGARPGINHANYRHLYIPIPMAFLMLGVRYFLERYWFAPIGVSLGIRNTRPKKAPQNELLEKAYAEEGGKFKHRTIQGLAKQLDWSERQVERWLRLRKSQDKPSTLTKFCENAWRCLYYTCSFIYGLVVLWDKGWLWDINECWTDYPHQSVTNDIWLYYMISLTFYWSLCVSQFFDVKRKDFWQMFVHHIATITLMGLSWTCNLYRIGSLVLVVHDCADIFLEAAKMAKYANYQKVCDVIFAIFTIVWIVTRLGVYPFWIIYKIYVKANSIYFQLPFMIKLQMCICIFLFILHLFWTYNILKILVYVIMHGETIDNRSETGSNFSDDATSTNKFVGNKKCNEKNVNDLLKKGSKSKFNGSIACAANKAALAANRDECAAKKRKNNVLLK